MRKEIGFNQRIQLEWLEQVAGSLSAGMSKDDIVAALSVTLKSDMPYGGDAKRGSREKVMTILLKTWVIVPKPLEPLRNNALQYFRDIPIEEHFVLHWGLATAVYPFFGTVAGIAGRLLRLQGSFTTTEVLRRVKEQFGDRETATRSASRILRGFIDWGILQDVKKKGNYQLAGTYPIKDKRIVAWIIEAMLFSEESKAGTLSALLQSPILFPFLPAPITVHDLEKTERFEIIQQGFAEDIVSIKN